MICKHENMKTEVYCIHSIITKSKQQAAHTGRLAALIEQFHLLQARRGHNGMRRTTLSHHPRGANAF